MSQPQMIEEIRLWLDGLPVRVEDDGVDLRFVWTGGEDGLEALGFKPPLPLYASRDDVPVWLLRRPGKSQIPDEYIRAENLYWRRVAPFKQKLSLAFEDCRQESLDLARAVALDYNELLALATAVAICLRREGLCHDRLPATWRKATGYLRDDEAPPSAHPSPPDFKWARAFESECARLSGLGSSPFVNAVTRRVSKVLEARASKMVRASSLRAREVVMTAFLEEIATDGDAARRPSLNSFWTWPYNIENPDQAFLGVLAMRLFKNDSAKHWRGVGPDFRDRVDFRFYHSPVDSPSEKGGLVVLKKKYRDPDLSVDVVLDTMTRVWQLHGGGKVQPVQLRTVKKRFKSALSSDVLVRLRKLQLAERHLGAVVEDRRRYVPPAKLERYLHRYIPLAASVAVERELDLAKKLGEPLPFGGSGAA